MRAFIESHERCYVVEQNRDGQLRSLLAIETGVARDSMTSILDYGGMPLTADRVVKGVHELAVILSDRPRVILSEAKDRSPPKAVHSRSTE